MWYGQSSIVNSVLIDSSKLLPSTRPKLPCYSGTSRLIKFSYLPFTTKLHWLPVIKRIKFKTATLAYQLVAFRQPTYISFHHRATHSSIFILNVMAIPGIWKNRDFRPIYYIYISLYPGHDTRQGHSYYEMQIGNRTHLKWYHFQSPWMTFNPDIKATILLASNKSTWYKIELYLQWPSIGSRLSCTWSIKQCQFQWPWTTAS